MTEPNCVFCRILRGEIQANVVYDGDDFLAVRDANPQAPVHVLFIAREHVVRHDHLPDDAYPLASFLLEAREAACAARLVDYRLVMNCGPGAGQTVGHMHAHILGGWEEPAPEIVGAS